MLAVHRVIVRERDLSSSGARAMFLDSDRGEPSSCPCWVRGEWCVRRSTPRFGLQAVKRMSSRPCIASPVVQTKSHTGNQQ